MSFPFYNGLSPIHGRGLFAHQYFPMGKILFKISDKCGNITELGQLLNHSYTPNIILHQEKDDYYAVSLMPIYPGIEITINYIYSPKNFQKPEKYWI
jgi:hypothetical protein